MNNAVATNDEIRLDAIEKRMDKYDELLATLRDAVIELKAHADTNYKWYAGMISVISAALGAILGHFIH